MANYKVETGFQLFTRLTSRPTLENIYPDLIPNNGPKVREVIEILGDSSTGKTFLATEFVAKCLLPAEMHNMDIGGKNAGAIVINTDHHFHIFTLIKIMENILKTCKNNTKTITSAQISDIINASLKNLIILNCFDSQQLFVTFHNLENILSSNKNVSLIVLDSILAYYWSDRQNGGIMRKDLYQKSILKLLQNMTKDYSLVIIFTKHMTSKRVVTEECCAQPALEKINYRIILEKDTNESNKFVAHVVLPDNTASLKSYRINELVQSL